MFDRTMPWLTPKKTASGITKSPTMTSTNGKPGGNDACIALIEIRVRGTVLCQMAMAQTAATTAMTLAGIHITAVIDGR
jgi:hypothetical protein